MADYRFGTTWGKENNVELFILCEVFIWFWANRLFSTPWRATALSHLNKLALFQKLKSKCCGCITFYFPSDVKRGDMPKRASQMEQMRGTPWLLAFQSTQHNRCNLCGVIGHIVVTGRGCHQKLMWVMSENEGQDSHVDYERENVSFGHILCTLWPCTHCKTTNAFKSPKLSFHVCMEHDSLAKFWWVTPWKP